MMVGDSVRLVYCRREQNVLGRKLKLPVFFCVWLF